MPWSSKTDSALREFLLDNNLPPKLAEVLKVMGFQVTHLKEVYGRGDIPDAEWMTDIAKKQWAAITYDRKIMARPNERAALQASGLVMIFATNAIQQFAPNKQVAFFIEHWAAAVKAAQSARPNRCWFLWQANGKVRPYE